MIWMEIVYVKIHLLHSRQHLWSMVSFTAPWDSLSVCAFSKSFWWLRFSFGAVKLMWWVITTPTEEDVKGGALEESHPLGWCAAGAPCHCPLWVQCGHFSVAYTSSTQFEAWQRWNLSQGAPVNSNPETSAVHALVMVTDFTVSCISAQQNSAGTSQTDVFEMPFPHCPHLCSFLVLGCRLFFMLTFLEPLFSSFYSLKLIEAESLF